MRKTLLFCSAISLYADRAYAEDPKYECIQQSMDAQTLKRTGKLLAARTEALGCARDLCPDILRSHCARWLGEILDQLPSLVVRVEDADGRDVFDARLTIDGVPAKLDGQPQQLDPGEHVVAVETPSLLRNEGRVLLAASEKGRMLVLQLPPAPRPPVALPDRIESQAQPRDATRDAATHRPLPVGTWFLGGLGVASLTAAGLFALEAQRQYDLVRTPAPVGCSPYCTAEQTASGRAFSLATYAALGLGLAASGVAVGLAVGSRGTEHASSAHAPWIAVQLTKDGASGTIRVSY